MKMELPPPIRGNNLMVVAHPDDEVLFGYSQLRNKNWHVVCVTGGHYPNRNIEFNNVMNRIGVSHEVWFYKDEWNGYITDGCLEKDISYLLNREWDNILTHNSMGDYGHTQHKVIYEALLAQVKQNLFVFDKDATILPFNILEEKLKMLSMYTSQYYLNAWDWYETGNDHNNLMTRVVSEGFKRIK